MGNVRCVLQELNPYNNRRQDISAVGILRLRLRGLIFGRAYISVLYGISFALGKLKLARRSLEGSTMPDWSSYINLGPGPSVSGVGRGANHRTPYKLIWLQKPTKGPYAVCDNSVPVPLIESVQPSPLVYLDNGRAVYLVMDGCTFNNFEFDHEKWLALLL